MSGQQIAADIAEAGDEPEVSWAKSIEAEAASPQLTWKAVRAAIWAAGQTNDGIRSQGAVESLFNNLKENTLAEAHKQLQFWVGMERKDRQDAGSNGINSIAQGARLAKEALDKEMDLLRDVGGRA